MSKPKPNPDLVHVTLAAPHTHAGKQLKKGDSIDVPPAQAEWLQRMGITQPIQQSGE